MRVSDVKDEIFARGSDGFPLPFDDPLCSSPGLVLSDVLVNNLGGKGPWSNYSNTIEFGNVFPDYPETINLVISTKDSTYEPHNSERNGLKGAFGVLNVMTGTKVKLEFKFVF